jgi:pimeloyl-ACP methyl ester carboxylesterase
MVVAMNGAALEERTPEVALGAERLRVRTLHFGAPRPGGARFLLLHGNPATGDDFERLGPRLGAFGEAVAPDLPGFGGTEPVPSSVAGTASTRTADTCASLLDQLGWQRATVVGHSHGGAIALVLAARHPERVDSLVLLGSLGYPAHLSYRLMSVPFAGDALAASMAALSPRGLGAVRRGLISAITKMGFAPDPPDPAWQARLVRFLERPDGLRTMAAIAAEDPSEELAAHAARVSCPVLMLHGAADTVVQLKYAKGLHAVLEKAGVRCDLEVMPRAGHMFTYANAAELAARIERFREAAGA